jgi:capsule polysaccharide modification protein KpsS
LIDENIKNVVPVSFSFDLQDPFEQFFDKLWSWDVHSEVILWRCSIRKGDGALIGN